MAESTQKKQIGLALSPRLIQEVDARADKDGESRTAFIEAALHRELERRRQQDSNQ